MKELKRLDLTATFIACIPLGIFAILMIIGILGSGGDSNRVFIFGYRPIITVTDSMEPAIMTNSLSMTKKVPFNELKIGDVIVFRNPAGETIVHRVYDIIENVLFTKGDANPTYDPWFVTGHMYYSKVISTNNNAANWITTVFGNFYPPDIYRMIVVIAVLVVVITAAIAGLIWVYQVITITWFFWKKRQSGLMDIPTWFDCRADEKTFVDLLDQSPKSVPLYRRWWFYLQQVALLNALDAERKQVVKIHKIMQSMNKHAKPGGE
jgi:signal peptidase